MRLSLATSQAEADVSGALWPGPDGTAADRNRVLAVLWQRSKLIAWLARAAEEPGDPAVPRGLAERLYALEPSYFAAVFHHPLFSAARLLPAVAEPARRRFLAGVPRFLLGTPVGEGLTWAAPASLLEGRPGEPAGLYLPHLHVLVHGPAPVRFEQRGAALTIRWADGATANLPAAGSWATIPAADPRVAGEDRVEPLPFVAGLPLLNGARELAGEMWGLDHAGPDAKAIDALENGRQLLQALWPEAAADVARFYHAALHVPGETGLTYSFTNASFLGCFCATWRDMVQVGDALCHEVSHTRLTPFFDLGGLIDGDDPPVHPSPWRKDLRPLRGLINGVHAFLNVCAFYHRLRVQLPDLARRAYPEAFERHRKGILEAWPYFRQHARLTPNGEALSREMDVAVDDLRALRGTFG